MEAKEYAKNIGNLWGVGEKEKYNGVVFLVSTDIEGRDVAIVPASGLESILTERVSGKILDEKVVPYFKAGQMYKGISEGVKGIMYQIDNKPTPAVPLTSEQIAKAKEADQAAARGFMYFIGALFVLVVLVLLISRIFNLKSAYKKNSETLERCRVKISDLELAHPGFMLALSALIKENPAAVWTGLKENFDKVVISDLWQSYFVVEDLHKKGWLSADKAIAKLESLEADLTLCSKFCDDIKAKAAAVAKAKAETPKLLASVSQEMAETKEIVEQSNVFTETLKMFANAKVDLSNIEASAKLVSPDADWIEVFSKLQGMKETLTQIQKSAEKDKALAARAMKEGPDLIKNLPELLAKLEGELTTSKARSMLEEAREKYRNAESLAHQGSGTTNWVNTYLMAMAANQLIGNAQESHQREIRAIQRSRSSSTIHRTPSSTFGGGGQFRSGSGASRNLRK